MINAINLLMRRRGIPGGFIRPGAAFWRGLFLYLPEAVGYFSKVIPLSGLRKDMEGYFCLVARSRASILGEEFVAERVNVELLYAGSSEAAIEGAVLPEDAVIVGENKSIGKGERVRPVSGF